jgi:hypothetical protein
MLVYCQSLQPADVRSRFLLPALNNFWVVLIHGAILYVMPADYSDLLRIHYEHVTYFCINWAREHLLYKDLGRSTYTATLYQN